MVISRLAESIYQSKAERKKLDVFSSVVEHVEHVNPHKALMHNPRSRNSKPQCSEPSKMMSRALEMEGAGERAIGIGKKVSQSCSSMIAARSGEDQERNSLSLSTVKPSAR